MNWQPIETAPKDGTVVELMNEHSGIEDRGFYDDYTSRDGYTLPGEWCTEFGNGDMTHWRAKPQESGCINSLGPSSPPTLINAFLASHRGQMK